MLGIRFLQVSSQGRRYTCQLKLPKHGSRAVDGRFPYGKIGSGAVDGRFPYAKIGSGAVDRLREDDSLRLL